MAANQFGVTPAAVKQAVLRLENDLGAKLVERRDTKILLTEVRKAGHVDFQWQMRFILDAGRKMKKAIAD